MSRAPHQPTREGRNLVQLAAAVGMPQSNIAGLMEIDQKTLRKHYREELTHGKERANLRVAAALFDQAINQKNVTAMIFWLKCQARWRTTDPLEIDAGAEGAEDDRPIIAVTVRGVPALPPPEDGESPGRG